MKAALAGLLVFVSMICIIDIFKSDDFLKYGILSFLSIVLLTPFISVIFLSIGEKNQVLYTALFSQSDLNWKYKAYLSLAIGIYFIIFYFGINSIFFGCQIAGEELMKMEIG